MRCPECGYGYGEHSCFVCGASFSDADTMFCPRCDDDVKVDHREIPYCTECELPLHPAAWEAEGDV